MAKSDKYTDEEWSVVSSIPQLVGAAMAGTGSSGLIGSTKEMFASVRSMMEAKKEYTSNELIQSVLPSTTDPKLAMADAKAQRDIVMSRIKDNNVKSAADLSGFVLSDCTNAIAILTEKESPEVVTEYKQWLLEVAENVANAAKEGGFLGFGGEKFSENEQKLMAELKTALA